MATKKPLVLDAAGNIQQLRPEDSLEGTGVGGDINFTASEAIAIRGVVYVTNAGQISNAQADAPTTAKAFGFASAAITGGASGPVRYNTVLSGFAGLTPGLPVFLSPTVEGEITQTAPIAQGQFVVRLGTAIGATEIEINIEPPILL